MKNLSFIYVCLAFFFAINLISENNESETLTLATVEKSFNDLMSNIDLNNRQKSEIRKNIVTQLQSLIDQDALNDPDQLSTALTIATNSALSSQQTESQIRKLKLAIEKKINNTGAPNNSLSTGLAETPVKKTPHELLVLKFKKQLQKVTDYTLSNEKQLKGHEVGYFTPADINALSEAIETNTNLLNLTIPNLSVRYTNDNRMYSSYIPLPQVEVLGKALLKNTTLETLTIAMHSSEHVIHLLELLEKGSLKKLNIGGRCDIQFDGDRTIWPSVRSTLLNNKNLAINVAPCSGRYREPQDFKEILKKDGTDARFFD
jgi:hypothetical protein